MRLPVKVEVNGLAREAAVEPRRLLVHFLREDLGLTGTHVGCETTNCGACAVLLDGRAVKSCTVLAVQCNGRKVTTIEGLGSAENLHPIQWAFWKKHGLQCGFCTPGLIISSYALLEKNKNPDEAEIRTALSGNLCRCTGYVKVFESVKYASQLMRKDPKRTYGVSKHRTKPERSTEYSGDSW